MAKKLTKDQQQLAIDMAREGSLFSGICRALGMSNHDFWAYREGNPDFRSRFMRACDDGCDALADKLLGVHEEYEDAQIAKLKSDNLKWWLGKRKPQAYGDRIDINVDGGIDLRVARAEATARLVAATPVLLQRTILKALPLPEPIDEERVSDLSSDEAEDLWS